MLNKKIYGECNSCESSFSISYTDMLTSKDYPEYCPFCGEPIEELSEDVSEEDELDLEDEWD